MKTNPKRYLAEYLKSERIKRGNLSTPKYLEKYPEVPISKGYYNELESGRQMIKFDNAEALCQGLKLNREEFYYYLLKDVLPEDVFNTLIRTVPQSTLVEEPTAMVDQLKDEISDLLKAYEKETEKTFYTSGEDTLDYLDRAPVEETFPLLNFVYSKDECTMQELIEVGQKFGISEARVCEILDDFGTYHIARQIPRTDKITRYRKTLYLPPTEKGDRVKKKYLKYEFDRVTSSPDRAVTIGAGKNFINAKFICIKDEHLVLIYKLITKLMATLDAKDTILTERDIHPYFFSIIFSSREEYMTASVTEAHPTHSP